MNDKRQSGSPLHAVHRNLSLGERLRQGNGRDVLLGTFLIELPTARAVRAFALAGFDFIVIDLEHSPCGVESLGALLAEAHAADLPAIVRVWTHESGHLGKVLDLGADGLLVPRVASAAEARRVVEGARYAPLGERGLAPLISYATATEPQTVVGNRPLLLLQLENRSAIDEAGDIMRIPGVDGVFIGPYDLSQAMGVPGDVNAEAVVAAAASIVAGAPPSAILATYVDDPSWSAAWARRGFRFQCVSFDGRMILEAARDVLRRASGVSAEGGA